MTSVCKSVSSGIASVKLRRGDDSAQQARVNANKSTFRGKMHTCPYIDATSKQTERHMHELHEENWWHYGAREA
eukprot:3717867-Pleurochrysis_carterae.AAC.5